MKRVLTFILALTMVLSLCACGSKKPAPGVVEITPDNWYVFFDVAESEPEITNEDGDYRNEDYYYSFRLKDEYADALVDVSDEADSEAYDFEALETTPWSSVEFTVSYDAVSGQCDPNGDVIPVLAQVESQTMQAYYSPDTADDPYAGSFAYMNMNYQGDVPNYASVLENLAVTGASGQLIMTPEAAEAAVAAAETAQAPIFETYDPGEPTEVPLTMENWQDYFEIKDMVQENTNAFGEVDSVYQEYSVSLKDEYLMKLAPGSNAIFQVTYTSTSPDGYTSEGDTDGTIEFTYLDSETGTFNLSLVSTSMQTDEAGQYITDEAGQYIPYDTYVLTMARVGGSLYLYN